MNLQSTHKEKLLTGRNQKLINEKIATQKATANLFNQVYEAYKKLAIDELSLSDLNKLIRPETNIKDFVKARMLKGRKMEMNVGGLKLAASALASMIEMPDLTELEEVIATFRVRFRFTDPQLDGLQIENSQVIVTPQWEASITEEHSLYADCEKEKELFLLMSEIVDKMNQMRVKYGIKDFIPGAHTYNFIFTHFCQDEKKFKVSANSLKRHCQAKPAFEG